MDILHAFVRVYATARRLSKADNALKTFVYDMASEPDYKIPLKQALNDIASDDPMPESLSHALVALQRALKLREQRYHAEMDLGKWKANALDILRHISIDELMREINNA